MNKHWKSSKNQEKERILAKKQGKKVKKLIKNHDPHAKFRVSEVKNEK